MNEISADVQSYLATASTSEFNQQDVEVLAQWEGSDNLLWRVQSNGQDAVLKLFLDAGQARGRRQNDGQLSFSPLGIAPRPLWFDRYPYGLSRQVLVYEWMPGEAVQPNDAGAMISLAQSVAQLHAGDPNDVRRFCPHPVNLDYFWRVQQGSFGPNREWLNQHNGSQLVPLFDELCSRSQALVETALPLWQGVSPAPVHGDVKLENVISSFGQTVLLDWEMFGLGDPALDVASFLHLEQQSIEEDVQSLWLESYLSQADQPGLAQRIGIYQRLLPFQSVCYLLDGIRSAEPELFADPETVQFLQKTLTISIQNSAAALGMENTQHLDDSITQIRWSDGA